MKALNLNGVIYQTRPVTFNDVCELEDMGYSLENLGDKALGTMRAFVAIWTGMSVQKAGEEIGKHIENGGTFDEIANTVTEAVEESGFFKNLGRTAPQDHKSKDTKASESNA